MALSIAQTIALHNLLREGMKVASFGYPDMIAPPSLMDRLVGTKTGLKYRTDSDAICRRHGMERRPIPDAEHLFALLGCTLHVYDIVQERGCEILCDLNDPMVVIHDYDIVLDVGTVEHCFNIGQAMMNMAGMVKVGGYIVHENPFNCGNHGFYNLNPTFYKDFYTANGFTVLSCLLSTRDGRVCDVPHASRFSFLEQEINTYALARRDSVVPFTFPMQAKYAKAAAGPSGERAASARAI